MRLAPAIYLSSEVQTELHKLIWRRPTPVRVAERGRAVLLAAAGFKASRFSLALISDYGHNGFTTGLAGHITVEGHITLANAGHLAAYLNGNEIAVPGSLPLGLVPQCQCESISMALCPGDRLTFVSDGVVEARSKSGELFGFERTQKISCEPAEAIAQAAQSFGQEDDIPVVTVEFTGVAQKFSGSRA